MTRIRNTFNSVVDHITGAAQQRSADEAYEQMIKASQDKLAETTLVPGYTNIYA